MENGYLFLADEANRKVLETNNMLQRQAGIDYITLLRSSKELQQRFPWLDCKEEVSMGSFGEKNEGYFDPWALLHAFKRKVCALPSCLGVVE